MVVTPQLRGEDDGRASSGGGGGGGGSGGGGGGGGGRCCCCCGGGGGGVARCDACIILLEGIAASPHDVAAWVRVRVRPHDVATVDEDHESVAQRRRVLVQPGVEHARLGEPALVALQRGAARCGPVAVAGVARRSGGHTPVRQMPRG
eukprot:scaffold68661_cov54-Phaeocystis_antarctica.AAC.1